MRARLARRLQWLRDAGEARSHQVLAEAVGHMSARRVGQLLRLLRLAPPILEVIEQDRDAQVALAESTLGRIVALEDPDAQVEAFHTALGSRRRRGRQVQGLQHHFAQARRFRRMLEEDPELTLKDIGQREGITGARVGQILLLLALAPEIIEAVDVPVARLPAGVTEQTLRPIARLRDHGEQVEVYGGVVGQV